MFERVSHTRLSMFIVKEKGNKVVLLTLLAESTFVSNLHKAFNKEITILSNYTKY